MPFHLYSRLYLGPLKSTKVAIFKEPTRRGRKKKDDEEGKRRGGVFGSKRGNLVPRFSLFPFFILFIYSLLPSVSRGRGPISVRFQGSTPYEITRLPCTAHFSADYARVDGSRINSAEALTPHRRCPLPVQRPRRFQPRQPDPRPRLSVLPRNHPWLSIDRKKMREKEKKRKKKRYNIIVRFNRSSSSFYYYYYSRLDDTKESTRAGIR